MKWLLKFNTNNSRRREAFLIRTTEMQGKLTGKATSTTKLLKRTLRMRRILILETTKVYMRTTKQARNINALKQVLTLKLKICVGG